MSRRVPPEFTLLAACCRWPAGPAREAAVRAAAQAPIDWQRFEGWALHHRVTALARNGLVKAGISLPPDVEGRLARATVAEGRASLAMAAETLRLQGLFDAAGLPILTIKGAPLALLAYGDLGMKQSRDIDLLTAPEHAAGARDLLAAQGYRPSGELRPASAAEFDMIRAFNIEQEFTHPGSGTVVELHWALLQNPLILDGLGTPLPTQDVPLGGKRLRTLGGEVLFAYLCVHGARHGWSRLKWLADLNALIARPGTDIAALHAAALRLGAGRTSAAALLLCHDILGAAVPGEILKAARTDAIVRWLAAHGRDGLLHEGHEIHDGRMPQAFRFRNRVSHLLLSGRRGYARAELSDMWTAPGDRLSVPLPPRFAFLYPALRLPLWVLRAGRDALRR